MADLSPAQKLAQLRQRWERDPKSRVFLQLAEEYRRAGRLAEAVRILESGLAVHPGYVAAQVVLGRCLLETGDVPRAANVLERAVATDPTQIVANRLLVDAYLGLEKVGKARERLDLLRLLNDRDADIEMLEARIAAQGGISRPIVSRGRPDSSGERALPTLALSPAAPAAPVTPAAPRPSPPKIESPAPWAALPDPEPARWPQFAASAPEIPAAGSTRGRSEAPFGALRGPRDRDRIVAAFAAGGVFPVRLQPAAPRPTTAARPVHRVEPVAPRAPFAAPVATFEPELVAAPPFLVASQEAEFVLVDEPALETVSELPLSFESAAAQQDVGMPELASDAETVFAGHEEPLALTSESSAPAEPAVLYEPEVPELPELPPLPELTAPPPHPLSPGAPAAAPARAVAATATLGSLYLSQGHLEDAEESFNSVLAVRPDDADALAGLAEVRRRRVEATAAFTDEVSDMQPGAGGVVGGMTERKIERLRQFMARMRRGAVSHVS